MTLQVIDIGYEPPPKPRILVVDDETSLQTLIFDTLEGDYSLVSAYNGREGVTKAEHMQPALILMDIMMPDLSGYDAVRLLHDNPATRHIPIVVISAQDFDASTVQMIKREPNVVAFLTKPFRPKTLRETIKTAIEKRV